MLYYICWRTWIESSLRSSSAIVRQFSAGCLGGHPADPSLIREKAIATLVAAEIERGAGPQIADFAQEFLFGTYIEFYPGR